jgi:hypothetical protein
MNLMILVFSDPFELFKLLHVSSVHVLHKNAELNKLCQCHAEVANQLELAVVREQPVDAQIYQSHQRVENSQVRMCKDVLIGCSKLD